MGRQRTGPSLLKHHPHILKLKGGGCLSSTSEVAAEPAVPAMVVARMVVFVFQLNASLPGGAALVVLNPNGYGKAS